MFNIHDVNSYDIVGSHRKQFFKFTQALLTNDMLYVYGKVGVGKTLFVKKCLSEQKDILMIYVHCNSICTSSRLYITIYNELDYLSNSRNPLNKRSVLSFTQFKILYTKLLDKISRKSKSDFKVVIVFDRVDVLVHRGVQAALIPLFELSQPPIEQPEGKSQILTQSVVITIFAPASLTIKCGSAYTFARKLLVESQVFYLGGWTKEEIIQNICCHYAELPFLYEKIINNTVQLYHKKPVSCMLECKKLAQDVYVDFLRFCRAQDIDLEEVKEYKEDEQRNIIVAYFRSIKSPVMNDRNIVSIEQSEKPELFQWHSCYLILAAYIANFSTPANDRMNFVKNQLRRKTRANSMRVGSIMSVKPFTLERLLQIFIALRKQTERPDCRLIDQDLALVTDLINMNILKQVNLDDLSSISRYVIAPDVVGRMIGRICKLIEVNISHYLPWWNESPDAFLKI